MKCAIYTGVSTDCSASNGIGLFSN